MGEWEWSFYLSIDVIGMPCKVYIDFSSYRTIIVNTQGLQ